MVALGLIILPKHAPLPPGSYGPGAVVSISLENWWKEVFDSAVSIGFAAFKEKKNCNK